MIKYRDITKKPEFDSAGNFLNTWNPDKDYGNEYASIHFCIRAYHYHYPYTACQDYAEKKTLFEDELRMIFAGLGWETTDRSPNGYSMVAKNDSQKLALMPQDISGIVLKNKIRKIAEALSCAKTYELEYVDVFRTVYEMSDEEYHAYLDSKRSEIRYRIFAETRMSRTINESALEERVLAPIRLCRLGDPEGYQRDGVAERFVREEIKNLETEGYLIRQDQNSKQANHCYRSIRDRQRRMRGLAAL